MANGNGVGTLPECGGHFTIAPVNTELRPFTVFAGSLPFFANGGATPANFLIPNLALILPADPRRVGLYMRINRNGVALSTKDRGVSITETIYDSNGGIIVNGMWFSVGPKVFMGSPLYAAHIDVAAFPATETIIQGISVVEL